MKSQNASHGFLRKMMAAILSAAFLTTLPLASRAGVVLELVYTNIAGTNIASLTGAPTFPNSPTAGIALTNGLAEQVNFAANFGAMTEGFIEAPVTGSYTFWIASADDGQFWLSTDSTTGNAVLVAQNVGAVGVRNYHVKASQQSSAISLVGGQKYYFKMLHKAGPNAEDHCSVAWSISGGASEDPIASSHLWPFPVDTTQPSFPPVTTAPTLLTDFNGTNTLTLASAPPAQDGWPLVLTTTFEASQPATVQWMSNGVAIPGANLLTYTIPVVTTAMNGVIYSVGVTNAIGSGSDQVTLSVSPNTTALTLLDALDLGNPGGDIAVVFSAPVDPVSATTMANYSFSPVATITGARMDANGYTVLLTAPGLSGAPGGYSVTVNNVKDLATTPNVIAGGSSIGLEQNLETWLKFDDRSGFTATDSSGNGNNGVFTNGFATAVGFSAMPDYVGKVFDAVKIDGAGGYVDLPPNGTDFSQGLTFAAWVNPTIEGGNASWARVVDFSNGAGSDNILFGRFATEDSFCLQIYTGGAGGPTTIAPDGTLATNQWQHIAATQDNSGDVSLYLNGVLVGTGFGAVPNVLTRSDMFVGRSPWVTDSYWGGFFDDVRVYNRPLSAAAIASLAASGGPNDVNTSDPVVGVAATVPTTAEKATPPGVFTITRSGATNTSVTVQYALGGTATNGINYATIPLNATLASGIVSDAVVVAPIDESFSQPSKNVSLTLLPSASYSLSFTNGAFDSDNITIQNNDSTNPPTPLLVSADSYSNPLEPDALNVWFDHAPTALTALNAAIYTLNNAPGVTVATAAFLGESGLGVTLAVSGPIPSGATLSINGIEDLAGHTGSSTVPIQIRLVPDNALATYFHAANIPDLNTPFSVKQADALAAVDDDIVNNVNNAPGGGGGVNGATGFDTFDQATGESQFAGLLYGTEVEITALKIDLGQQFGDGGSWNSLPTVYILKNPTNTLFTRPETDPADWQPVNAQLVSGSSFGSLVGPNPSTNTPIVFSLANVSSVDRTGYGWAVGGVSGDGATGFISLSELRGYGTAQATPADSIGSQTNVASVNAGARATLTANVNSTAGLTYQWLEDGTNIDGATDPSYNILPANSSDNGAVFSVIVNGGGLSVTSVVATLAVKPQTTPPMVTQATYSPVAEAVDLYFNDVVSAASAGNTAAYTLNDPGLVISAATVDVKGYFVELTVSGNQTLSNLTVSVTNVTDIFNNTNPGQTASVLALNWPVENVVADTFQQGRTDSLTLSTNGIVTQTVGSEVWQTFFGPPIPFSFVGLTYSQAHVFKLLKVDLGYTFVDGGDWAEQPYVYILKHNVDTDMTEPQTDTNDWEEVPAVLITGNVFQLETDVPANDATTNSPITFDLTGLPLSERTGYGFAVGGVVANGANQFLSISELSSFGTLALPSAGVTLGVAQAAGQITLTWPQSAAGYTLQSSPALGSTAVWTDVSAVPQIIGGQYTVTLQASGSAAFYRLAQ